MWNWQKSLLLMVATVAILSGSFTINRAYSTEASETELHRVSLSVASLMADPTTPVHNLATDERIASFVSCSTPLIVPDENADDAAMMAYGYTRDLSVLIQLASPPNGAPPYDGENEAQPLTEYSWRDTTDHWYCVYEDGSVHGFNKCDTNMNLFEFSGNFCDEEDTRRSNHWWWIAIATVLFVAWMAFLLRRSFFRGKIKPDKLP